MRVNVSALLFWLFLSSTIIAIASPSPRTYIILAALGTLLLACLLVDVCDEVKALNPKRKDAEANNIEDEDDDAFD